jgi:hypothetical protein
MAGLCHFKAPAKCAYGNERLTAISHLAREERCRRSGTRRTVVSDRGFAKLLIARR